MFDVPFLNLSQSSVLKQFSAREGPPCIGAPDEHDDTQDGPLCWPAIHCSY
jgi:hypothetical protein